MKADKVPRGVAGRCVSPHAALAGRHTFESRFHDEELQGESVAVFTG